MTYSASQKVAIITGASKRIGREITSQLHKRGFNVAIHYHHSKIEAETLATSLNNVRTHSAITVSGNFLNLDIFPPLVEAVIDNWGQLDLLVNNASSFYPTPVEEATINLETTNLETTQQAWDDLMGSNLKAPYFLSLACIPFLKLTQGKIINIVDIYGLQPLIHHSIYSMAKAGLIMMTKALAKELAPDIEVNAVAPGAILWPEDNAELSSEKKQKIIDNTAMKTQGNASDIAQAVTFLACDAQYISGNIIKVDGGRF